MNSRRSWQLAAGRWQKAWGRTLILLCVLALSPVLQANDDGEILDASIVLTVSPDFKVKEEVSITKRLLSYQALDTDGDPRTPYCGPLQTLTITKARVTTPGGKVVDCTPNALNLSTPEALVAHPILTGWQEMVVTFLGLEPGSQTELSYIREDKSAFRTTFEKKQVLAWHFAIRKGTVTVRLPKGMALTYQIMNFQGEVSANAIADLMEYTFVFKDIPAYSDRDMHNGMAFLPTLYLTTTPSWEAAGKNLAALAEKYGSPDEAITKKAKELTKDATTDLDKAIAIHKFVKERFAEVEWPLQDSLLLFNDAGKTFAAGQGTNLELALLLRAMMKAGGLRAELQVSGPLPFADKTPGLMAFNRAMIDFGGLLIPSGIAATMPSADELVLNIPQLDEFYESIKFIPSANISLDLMSQAILGENKGNYHIDGESNEGISQQGARLGVAINGEIEIQKENYIGKATLIFSDCLNPYWNNLEEKNALETFSKNFLPLQGLKIEDTQIKMLEGKATRIEIDFTGKIKDGERALRLLPEAKVILPGIDARTAYSPLPKMLPMTKVEIKWTIKGVGIPEPLAMNSSSDWGEVSIDRTAGNESFTLGGKMDLEGWILPPADYPGLQAALAQWQNPVVAGVLLP